MFDFNPIVGYLGIAFVAGFSAGLVAVFIKRLRDVV